MADQKLTALTAATSWASGDLLYCVRDPAGTPVSRKITLDNVLQNIVSAANTKSIGVTGYSLTGSNASSMIDLAGTLNTTGNPSLIKVAISNTASGATTKFISLLAGAAGTTEVFSVDKDGLLRVHANNQGIWVGANDGIRNGIGSVNGTELSLYAVGVHHSTMDNTGLRCRSDRVIAFSSDTNPRSTLDTILLRDGAANTLALRNSTAAQALNIYNTYTSGSVYERGFMRWVGNVLEIGTEHVGASARALAFKTNNTDRFTIGTTGASVFTGSVKCALLSLHSSNNVYLYGDTNGILSLYNSAQTGFDRLQFGGTTSSFPSIKRSTTLLQARLADDSDFGTYQGKLRVHANATSETVTPTHTLRLFDAAGTEYRVPAIAV